MEVIIVSNYDEICSATARMIQQEWEKKNNLVLGLPTGSTPLGVYKKLIELHQKNKMDFSDVITFSLDEYLGLKPDHPQSFAYYLQENFFRHINIKKDNIFRLAGNPDDIAQHCQDYEEKIKSFGGIDIQLLGIGRNGHIGFNEPSSSLSSRTRIKTLTQETMRDNTRFFKDEVTPRFVLTMGIGTLMEAKMVVLLASGEEKQNAILNSVEGPVTAFVPASILQLHPQAKIIIDEEAASLLTRKDYYKWVFQNKERVKNFLK